MSGKNLRPRVIELYKTLLYYGKEYPLGYEYFRERLKKAFLGNKDVTDPEKIEQLIARGEFPIKYNDSSKSLLPKDIIDKEKKRPAPRQRRKKQPEEPTKSEGNSENRTTDEVSDEESEQEYGYMILEQDTQDNTNNTHSDQDRERDLGDQRILPISSDEPTIEFDMSEQKLHEVMST
ncbi:Hypothetical predicted protein [Mytilus galloprovincialis]|uniref:Complex 1 LYR protein domain-containing protein n=1 Tax=Mytilus galloprovincialis TaxID=29158 RepID=A0A8B6EVU1_MYTGA|nr:Hypothetical predicted protein [Mytilus galloprovincialis]